MFYYKNSKKLPSLIYFGVASILLLSLSKAYADKDDKFDMNIQISGTVIATGNCSFLQDGSNDIDFGEVTYNPDEGSAFEDSHIETLASEMSCNGDVDGKVQMKLSTTSGNNISDGTNNLLPVMLVKGGQSKSMGIRLIKENTPTDVGEWFDVSIDTPVKLEAELIRIGDGKDLVSGDKFTAGATLTVAFN